VYALRQLIAAADMHLRASVGEDKNRAVQTNAGNFAVRTDATGTEEYNVEKSL
jgi:hypothetical protein